MVVINQMALQMKRPLSVAYSVCSGACIGGGVVGGYVVC